MPSVLIPVKGSPTFAIVDEEDAPRVLQHLWRVHYKNKKPWVVTIIDKEIVRLSRFVMGDTPLDGFVVLTDPDFPFDCRKSTLRRVPEPFDQVAARDKRENRREWTKSKALLGGFHGESRHPAR